MSAAADGVELGIEALWGCLQQLHSAGSESARCAVVRAIQIQAGIVGDAATDLLAALELERDRHGLDGGSL